MNLDPEVLSESSVEHLHGRAAAYRQLSDECERQEFLSNLASHCHDLAYSCLDEVARREAVAAHVPSIYGARQWCLVCTHYEPRDDCCNGCGAASEYNLRPISFEPKVHNSAADAPPTTSDVEAARMRGEQSWNHARDQARHVLQEASAELAQLRAELGMLRVDFVAVDADRSEAWGEVHALRAEVERLKGSAPSALVDWARSTLALWDRCTTREETNGGHLEPPNSTVLNVLVGVYERDKLRAALADTKDNIAGLTAGGLTAEREDILREMRHLAKSPKAGLTEEYRVALCMLANRVAALPTGVPMPDAFIAWAKRTLSELDRSTCFSGDGPPHLLSDTVREMTRLGREALAGAALPTGADGLSSSAEVDALRADGWSVAVHNDYRLDGVRHTFWLFTRDNQCAKGEGKTDLEALARVRTAIAALAPVADAVEELEKVARWARNVGGRLTWNDVFDYCTARAAELRGKEMT